MGPDPAKLMVPDPLPNATTSTSPAATTASESPQRYVLPKNFPNALKHLSNDELDLMHEATLEEMKRRGRAPQSERTKSLPAEKRQRDGIAEAPLTRGKVSAVRSAFKAGITPSRIAREFGIPLSDVRKALASDEKQR
jgi:hypothetical protein